ncbi:MlaC/ttg2D family ABC transporter substrate-binding protein [Limibacillus halophilus]|uniref:Phospholipid transport system substrate-binding protein n=1 Tax=Limibacillus halophilus TaxID=1579333 RepID=A0A839SV96_9PROT|nr:ABC transporter substrate-binding protein [Limibacillus halophilus]MBB3064873.1 phospholipid transport system substrate-binding protein [Limibacillus halophilus]
MDKLNDIMTGRRTVVSVLAGFALAAFMLLVPVELRASGTPEAFIGQLRDSAVKELTDKSVPHEQRKQRFRQLLAEGFDIPAIGSFVTAKYWRRADAAAQQDFLDVFQDVITLRFLPIFDHFEEGTELEVNRVVNDKDSPRVIDVFSTLVRPVGEPVSIAWRILETDSVYQIVDVRVENLSMAITLRSEYTSLLQRHNGDMAALAKELRRRVAAGDVGDPAITNAQ